MIRTFGAVLATAAAATMMVTATGAEAQAAKARTFANCTAMHKAYPHGVGKAGAHDKVKGKTKPVTNFYRSTAIYNANKKSDRDHDGVACEKR